MDPDANLREQREVASNIIKTIDECNGDGTLLEDQSAKLAYLADRLAQLVISLDEWLAYGGTKPKRWEREEPV